MQPSAPHDLYVLTSLLLRDKTLPRSSGEGPMSTIVHYECRNLDHLRAGSRRGKGGLVIHHGSVGYCDGMHVDGAHRWVATGGIPIEYLYDTSAPLDAGTYRASGGALVHVRPARNGALLVEVDGAQRGHGSDIELGAKLSDDPNWPDLSDARVTLLQAD